MQIFLKNSELSLRVMRSMSVVGELDSFKWRSPGRKFHTLEALTYKKCYMVVRTGRPDGSS